MKSLSLVQSKRAGKWILPIIIFVLIIVLRIPAILCKAEINVDESLFAAQALRYYINPTPWGGVDSTTSGPLNTLPFYIISIVAGPWTFQRIHLFAAAMQAVIGLFTWKILRKTCCPTVATSGTIIYILFIAVAQSDDFVHFSSELIPATMLAAATYCMARAHNRDSAHNKAWSYCGCLLAGTAPWAKLQAAPISLIFLFYAVLMTYIHWGRRHDEGGSKNLQVAYIMFAYSLPTIIVLILVIANGAVQDFLQSYVLRNFGYAGGSDAGFVIRVVKLFLSASPARAITLGLAFITIGWSLLKFPGWETSSNQWKCWFTFLTIQFGAALLSVAKPPYGFPHYAWFLIVPGILLIAAIMQTLCSEQTQAKTLLDGSSYKNTVIILTTALILSIQIAYFPKTLLNTRYNLGRQPDSFQALVSERISARVDGSKTLGVWGWAPSLYVSTALAPASRHAIGHYVIEDSPQRDHFRQSFITDLKKSRPRVIVDTVASGLFRWGEWPKESRIESFSELTEMLRSEYQLVEEVRISPESTPVRIYLLSSQ